jgi:hypothetical protein
VDWLTSVHLLEFCGKLGLFVGLGLPWWIVANCWIAGSMLYAGRLSLGGFMAGD